MHEPPPILQWKVMLSLVAVVVVAVALAGALQSNGHHPSGRRFTFHMFSVSTPIGTGKMTYRTRRELCANLRAQIPKTQSAARTALRNFCHRR